ncbi:MAG: citrate synthase, partial [Rhizobiales bacterium]|nr:citrate synthase [Hyphomicrobiales bacterium]
MAWMTAGEALAALGTRPQTLYANVSRGRIEAKPDPADPRRSLYSAADVKRLAARRRRLKSETLAADAIRWGDPVLSSALSTVQRGRLFYRGRDAAALASHATLEDVAALLWRAPTVGFSREPLKRGAPDAETPITRAFLALSALAGAALPTLGRSESALHAEACAVVSAMADAMLRDDARARRRSLHERIAAAWAKPKAADPIRRALVLLADHDLNASTFAARVAASTGASLAACALSGLATLTGPRHGGASAAAQAFAASATRDGVGAAVRAW